MSETEVPQQSIGERMKEAFGGLDMRAATRIIFNKCPNCGKPMGRGSWLRWCPDRTCKGFAGPLNKGLQDKIDFVLPRNPDEQAQLRRIADEFGVETS